MGVLGRLTAEQWAAMQNARRRRLRAGSGPEPQPWSPSELFANGEQGAWYDPSDLSTVFQDTAGTIPAAFGDPVGLVLDKSGNGINLSQPTASARPTLGRVPVTGRRNLLTWTEEFDNAAWTKSGAAIVANQAVAPDGTTTMDKLVEAASTSAHAVRQDPFTRNTNESFVHFIAAKAAERTHLCINVRGTAARAIASFNLLDGSVRATRVAGVNGVSMDASTAYLGNDIWLCIVRSTFSNVLGHVEFQVDDGTTALTDDGCSYAGDGTSGIYIWGAQRELGSTPTAYQRVGNRYDVTEEGVPDCYYLRPDLTDDALTTVLPQAINGDILIAGTNGSIIEPVSYAASSTFALGPDTYTDGASGVLAAVGDIVAVLLIDKTLTQLERDNLVAYYQAKGAGGLL